MEHKIIQNQKEEDGQLRDYPKYQENPFIPDAVEELQKKVVIKQELGRGLDKKAIALRDDEGKIYQTGFFRTIEVDETQFTKLYINQIGIFNNLSTPGYRVLTYLMSVLKPNSNEIIFERSKCMAACGYKTHKSVYKGLTELIEAKIIARSCNDWMYFINPLVFYNGDRCVFANEYIKKKNPGVVSPKSKFLTNSLRQVENKKYLDEKIKQAEELKDWVESDQETPMQRKLRIEKEGPNVGDILNGPEFQDVDFSKPMNKQ